jgi:hypothetical protein
MKHSASPRFWKLYAALPLEVQTVATKNYRLMRDNPAHPSLHLKQIGRLWSARVGDAHRAVGLDDPAGIYWIWIGSHSEYDHFLRRRK